jgi:VIT1/CCC1 family predicted Fe2+/Mn2+ transporter
VSGLKISRIMEGEDANRVDQQQRGDHLAMTKLHKTIIVFISIITAAFCGSVLFMLPFVLFGEHVGGMIILILSVGALVFVLYLWAETIVDEYWK